MTRFRGYRLLNYYPYYNSNFIEGNIIFIPEKIIRKVLLAHYPSHLLTKITTVTCTTPVQSSWELANVKNNNKKKKDGKKKKQSKYHITQ